MRKPHSFIQEHAYRSTKQAKFYNLSPLKLGGIKDVTDAILMLIFSSLPRLASLDISYCESVVGEGFQAFKHTVSSYTHSEIPDKVKQCQAICQETFRNLDMTGCMSVKAEHVKALRENCLVTITNKAAPWFMRNNERCQEQTLDFQIGIPKYEL